MTKNSICTKTTGLANASPFAFLLKAIFILFFLALSVKALAKSEADDSFVEGLQAAKNGDYARAITHFRHARRLGKKSDALLYNLGVCFYKLQDYDAAITWFELLLASESNRGLALYNLGLAHAQLGQNVQAVRWFKRVLSSDADNKIKALAARQIKTLYSQQQAQIKTARTQQQAVRNKRWHAGISLDAGWDDNIVYPESETSSNEGDTFAGYFAWGRVRAWGDSRFGVRARALAYGTNFQNANDYDRQVVQGSLAPYWRWQTWTYELSAGQEISSLGSEDYLSAEKYQFSARKYIKRGSSAVIKYGYDKISDESPNLYPWLEGDRHYLSFNYYSGDGPFRYRLNYNIEKNIREDRNVEDYFFSYSPFRQYLGLQWEQTWFERLVTRQGIAYRYSQYRDENFFQEEGAEVYRQREDEKLSFQLGVGYIIHPRFSVDLEYNSHRNDSNISYYEYDQDLLSLGVNFAY